MYTPSTPPRKSRHAVAARHICEEVRVVLSSLRDGPPDVAYGELAQNLRRLRTKVRAQYLDVTVLPDSSMVEEESPMLDMGGLSSSISSSNVPSTTGLEEQGLSNASELQESNDSKSSTSLIDQDDSNTPQTTSEGEMPEAQKNLQSENNSEYIWDEGDVGPYAQPFLAVVMDPRAAGPHTLVALRALHHLIERGSLVPSDSNKMTATSKNDNAQMGKRNKLQHIVFLDPLMIGVLQCKFEQTDAGADEAVEMAIADLLSLMISIDASHCDHGMGSALIRPETFMDAFNTVFVTRNTFVHSPALCYHFEDVLKGMVHSAFRKKWKNPNQNDVVGTSVSNKVVSSSAAKLILEFLVQQLLHTPFILNASGDGRLEAQNAHDATRVLCLRLSRSCLFTGWGDSEYFHENKGYIEEEKNIIDGASQMVADWDEESVLRIIKDEFCLSLLMTGQAFWHDGIEGPPGSTGILSSEVLSEVCATISTLWSISSLRNRLETQFEAIFTGFFQRALSLLRKRSIPMDSEEYMANIFFDSEIEIVLESLVDILHLHDRSGTDKKDGKGGLGALETLFLMYDCNLNRSDVALGLITELKKCCGGDVKMVEIEDPVNNPRSEFDDIASNASSDGSPNRRQVPARLKELCGDALIGSLQCIFGGPLVSDVSSIQSTDGYNKKTSNLLSSQISKDTKPRHDLRKEKNTKRIMHKGALLFNKKSKEGIKFLITEGILPTPTAPKDVAKFLREGLVVGLDKVAVGNYLGEAGKAPVAGKSPHDCERDWFHKETLREYCNLFRFENQTLLDGLRMFLSSFRLPGEAQQIDRILQAFAESCGKQCEENRTMRLFSDDPKKAADAAYLLAFSLIMLNTDLHNDNIRPERKMSKADFVKNNTNYGRDITDEGKDLPREMLEGLYNSIKEVELRTEGEGADGVMTIERWKDVLRGHCRQSDSNEESPIVSKYNIVYSELKNILVETIWSPILASISGFWGTYDYIDSSFESSEHEKESEFSSGSEMLGSQGSRLGIDLATKLLNGLRSMGRHDLFLSVFVKICNFSGLLHFPHGLLDRTALFNNSFERQSALVVAITTAKDAADEIGITGWKYVWGMLFELRDLKLLSKNKRTGLAFESDHDMLSPATRGKWKKNLVQQGTGRRASDPSTDNNSMGVMGAMSRMLFGETERHSSSVSLSSLDEPMVSSTHEKESLLLWDDLGQDEDDSTIGESTMSLEMNGRPISLGEAFENLLILENDTITYEERMFLNNSSSISTRRARVRSRLSNACDFASLISGSRYQSLEGIQDLLVALIELIKQNQAHLYGLRDDHPDGDNYHHLQHDGSIIMSPASDAFAEILICEIAIKNRDRINPLWENVLKGHYYQRLGNRNQTDLVMEDESMKALTYPGIEKCVTGLLRISCWMLNRGKVSNEILKSLNLLIPPTSKCNFVHYHMDKHLAESMWRISCDLDSLQLLESEGWSAFLGLVKWCASLGGKVVLSGSRRGGLAEDDPSLQAFRAINLMLHAKELKNKVPSNVVDSILALIDSGEAGYCAKLMIAGLDLLNVLHSRLESSVEMTELKEESNLWRDCWFKILKGMTKAAKESSFVNVRQHAISMLTDALIDKHGRSLPLNDLYIILNEMSTPLAAQRISFLLKTEEVETIWEEIMIELELCVSLIFKPLLHHLRYLLNDRDTFLEFWQSVLSAVALLLSDEQGIDGDDANARTMDNILSATRELAKEHLRNAVMVLTASSVLTNESNIDGTDISSVTWKSIQSMEFCKVDVKEWKNSALGNNEVIVPTKEHKSDTESDEDIVIVSEVGEATSESN